jgi:hypothetical protein
VLRPERLEAAITASGLTFDGDHGQAQLDALHRLGTGGKLGVVIGSAGAGKTTLLQPLVSAWQEAGRDVHGIALAWRQADDLTNTGIAKENVKAFSVFLKAAQEGEMTLTEHSVVVVDEISLLGTRPGLDLLRLQADHGFRIAMLGDDKQCQSIEAGPMIELVRRALGAEQVPEILSTVRQQTEREKEIVGLLRTGETKSVVQALAMKREDGTAAMVPGGYRETIERAAQLVATLLRENAADPDYVLTVSAPTNRDAHQLGLAIREKRRALGQVGPDLVTIKAADREGNVYDLALAAGDKVRLFASTRVKGERGSIGRNGTVLTVVNAEKEGLTIRNASGREGVIDWKTLTKDGRVRLAYGEVQTTYTAQGSTATDHIYVLPAGTKAVMGFSAYSSGTRHKRTSHLLISEGAERQGVARSRPINDVRPIKESDIWSHAAENLSRMPTKALAIDLLKSTAGTADRAARRLQQHGMAQEQRGRKGQRRMDLSNRLDRQRQAKTAIPALAKLERSVTQRDAALEGLGRIGDEVEKIVARAIVNAKPALQKAVASGRKQPIPRNHIDELKHTVSLTSLIGQSVKFDHHGRGWCPFHDEKTPSFDVNEKKGVYLCRGCGASGDAMTWLKEWHGMSFTDTVAYLEGRTGILPPLKINKQEKAGPEWVPVQPIPPGVPPLLQPDGRTAEVFNPKRDGSKAYRPSHVAAYKDEAGQPHGYVLRVEMKDGKKFTPQITWAVGSSFFSVHPHKMNSSLYTVRHCTQGKYA